MHLGHVGHNLARNLQSRLGELTSLIQGPPTFVSLASVNTAPSLLTTAIVIIVQWNKDCTFLNDILLLSFSIQTQRENEALQPFHRKQASMWKALWMMYSQASSRTGKWDC